MNKFERMLKNTDYFAIAATSVILIFVTRALPVWVNSWMLLQWNITYETGFICRGLAGSIIHLIFDPLITNDLMAVGIVNLVLYALVLNFFLLWLYRNNRTMGMFIFIIFFLSSPFITQWYFTPAMFERLDVILNILFIISVYIIMKSKNKPALTYAVLLAISALGLFIHDGYAVYSVPCIFGIMMLSAYHKNDKWRIWHPAALYLAPIALLYIAILYFGKPNMPIEAYHELLNSKTGEVAFKLSNIKSMFYMSLSEKVDYTIQMMSLHKVINLIGTVLLMSPSVAIIVYLWASILKAAKRKLQTVLVVFLGLCTLSTLAAYLFAVDTMRWLGYIVFNNLFAFASVIMMDESYALIIKDKLDSLKYIMIVAIILAVILGPTQWMDGFAIVDKIAALFGLS
jgi:hypothetical protein